MTIHRSVQTFGELAAWLVRQIENLDADCNDGESIGSIGLDAHKRSMARVSAYRDVLHQIAPALLIEASGQCYDDNGDRLHDMLCSRSDGECRTAVAAEDAVDAAYKEAGYGSLEPVIARYADGDR